MGCRRTGVRIGLSLLGTLAFGASCHAMPRNQQAGVGTERSANEASPDAKVEKSKISIQPAPDWEDRENSVGLHLLKNIADDQKAVWVGPKSLRWDDADWLVPLGGAAAAMFATDSSYSRHLSNSPNRIKYSKDVSNYGLASMVGIGGGLYLWGQITHDDHKMETGILAGEAAIDSLIPVYGMKYAFGRERPLQDNYRGRFGQAGVSFPSEHAAAAWSIASVIAHEYPGPLTSLFVYGLASAVSASRISAKQHFPSDVLIGSAIGWLEGMYVYRKHHDPKIGGGEWETYAEAHDHADRSPANMGSPYVPLDSWIYPALERLAALGYIDTTVLGLRPWTRLECARLVSEAADHQIDSAESSDLSKFYESLSREFGYEQKVVAGERNQNAQLESVYARFTSISGGPLTYNYHFGQTIVNDFGRPFERGFNSVDGMSAWAAEGPFVFYTRGEYQHAPSAPAPSQAVLSFISGVDGLPAGAPATPISATNRFRLLDTYVGMNLANWQFSFGKQSLWWGPNEGGPFLFSDNAEPITMFRISRNTPFRLPWIFHLLGEIRVEFFNGQLSGHEFVVRSSGASSTVIGQFGRSLNPQPFINGEKISLKFTSNFELGLSKTSIYSGEGIPLTVPNFLKSIYDPGTGNGASPFGDGRTAVDFSYRIPKLRNWLTLYGEGFSEDEISPIAYPGKSVWQAGLYMPKLPRLPKLDLRFEGGTTSAPDFSGGGCDFCFYENNQYLNAYTNDGKLMGAALGRSAQGEDIRSSYWLSPRSKIGIQLRHRKIDGTYLPAGGTQNDASISADFFVNSSFSLSTSVQYEKWQIPLLASGPQSNVAASVQFTFWPQSRIR